jgi:hypothetical protein
MEPRNQFQGMNSTSLCSLAGRYDNPIPTRFLTPIDCLKIPAQEAGEVNSLESIPGLLRSLKIPSEFSILLGQKVFELIAVLSSPYIKIRPVWPKQRPNSHGYLRQISINCNIFEAGERNDISAENYH